MILDRFPAANRDRLQAELKPERYTGLLANSMRSLGLAVAPSLVVALAAALPALPQAASAQAGELDANKTLFVVLAAANLSGYDAGTELLTNSAMRQKVRDKLSKEKLSSIVPIRSLLTSIRPKDPASELYRYIEFSILSAGPPSFRPARSDLPRPPELSPLDELPELLSSFYQEAHLEDLWKELQPEYDAYLEDFGPAVRRALLESNAYIRMDTGGYLGHRFLVWVEPLGQPNQVLTFAYMDDYHVVVTPAPEVPSDDIRHAYLHYLLEPIAIKYSAELKTKSALYDYTQNAPLVADVYKRDQWIEFASECLVKAVEARIAHKPAMVDRALKEGYILTPAFADQLVGFENQESPLRLYFPEMIEKIDVKKEAKRVANVQFVTERAVRTVHVKAPDAPPPPVLTGAAKTLEDAEKDYSAHAFSDKKVGLAKELYLKSLSETDQNPMHAKAYYGLARIAAIENNPDEAERMFHKALESDPDPMVKAWCLLYLGRLSDNMQDGRQQAVEFYKAALAVDGVPEQVREAAQRGLNQAFTNTK